MKTTRLGLLLGFAWAATLGVAQAGGTTNAAIESSDLTALSLEELMNIPVRSASGFDQHASEAPSSVTVLTRNDLQAFGYRTLADALSSVAGFYSTYDRTYQYLGVRGFDRPGDYNTRTLILINGVRVNDPIYSQGRIGTDFPLDLDLIERIEVVRGPSSSLYGSSAFFAVINIVTRDAKAMAPAEVSAAAGSYDAFSGRFSLAQVFGEQGSILISGSLLNSEGDDLYFPAYNSPKSNNGVAEDMDGDRVGSLFLQARYGGWTLQAIHMDRTKDRPTASYGSIFNDPQADDRDRETLADLSWEGDLAKDWTGMARVGYQRYEYGADWPDDHAAPGQPPVRMVDRDSATAETVGGEIRVGTTMVPRNRLTAGAELRDAFRLDQRYVSSGEDVFDSHENQLNFGAYAQDEIRLSSWALANAGLRYDCQESQSENDMSPRSALILQPFEGSVIKLIYGEAFRAPTAYERFYSDGGVSMEANPDLNPEKIRTREVVWEQRVVEWLQLNASLYRYEIKDLITAVVDPANDLFQFRNITEVRAQGGEVRGRVELPAGFELRGSYSYCEADDDATGQQLSNSPKHLVKVNMLAPVVPRRLTAGIEAQYVSDCLTVQRAEVEDYVVVNVTLMAYRLARNLDVSLSVYNLFDKNYAQPVGEEIQGGVVTQDGRTLRLKAVYRF